MTLQSVARLWLGQQAVMAVAAVAVVAVAVVLAVAVMVVVLVVVMGMGMNGAWQATASPPARPRGPRPPSR